MNRPVPDADLLVVTALRSEYAALFGRVPGAHLERCGMGPVRVARWLPRLAGLGPRAVVVAGVAGGLDPAVRPGDVIVADEVRGDAGGSIALAAAAPLVAELRRLGLRTHSGPVVTADHLVDGVERVRLAESGALAVDMESGGIVAAVAQLPGSVPAAVVRVVVDTADSPLAGLATITAGASALRTLRRLAPLLSSWAALMGSRSGVPDPVELVEHAVTRVGVRSALPREVVE
jgi:4-hydroxy-3-methylbut-2-enyl diphosphate reductase